MSGTRVPNAAVAIVAAVGLAGCQAGTLPGDSASVGPAARQIAPPPAPTSPPAASAAPRRPAGQRWIPRPGTTWQWQLTTPVDLTVDAQVFDIDGTENDASVVAALQARGRKVICYVNTGAVEDFRPDYRAFPADVQGATNGWPGERWLDIRRLDVLRPIMAARFDECARKGFDAIEADLVDGYTNETGFPLTAADQLAYNRMLAGLAHDRGLSIGLKNDLEQVADLVGDFDFAVNEQCMEFSECDQLGAFIAAGKAVFHVEYNLTNAQFCGRTRTLGFSSMRKNLDLGVFREPC